MSRPTRSNVICALLALLLTSNLKAETIRLQLRWDHQFQFAGYYAALWEGFFRDEGLEVEIRSAVLPGERILSAVDEVASGRAEFGVGAADVLLADDGTKRFTIVASIFQESAAAFYSLRGRGPRSLVDLTELRVARRIGDLIDVELQAMLRAEGISPDRVPPFSHEPGIDHLVGGKVDVVPGYAFSLPIELDAAGIPCDVLRPSDYGIRFYGDSLFTRRELVRNRPGLVAAFRRASLKGWQHVLAHRDAMVEAIARRLPRTASLKDPSAFNRAQAQRLVPLLLHPTVPVGNTSLHRWKEMHEHLRRCGLLRTSFDADLVYSPEAEALRSLRRTQARSKQLSESVIALALLAAAAIIWGWTLRRTVRARTADLKREKGRLDAIYAAASSVAIIATDLGGEDTVVRSFNTGAERIFGWTAKEMIGRPVARLHTPVTIREFPSMQAELRASGRGFSGECTLLRRDGSPFPALFTLHPLRDEDGVICGTVGVTIDLTPLKQAEAERARFEDRLLQSQKLEALGTLAGGVAHEFNNVLAIVQGAVEEARADALAQDSVEDCLRTVQSATERGRSIASSLLGLSRRIPAARPTVVAVASLLGEVDRILQATRPPHVQVEIRPAPDDWAVLADGPSVEQILLNLCGNAIQALGDEGGRIEIEATHDPTPPGWIRFVVGDTGPGVDADHVTRIFDPFFTTKACVGGSGLGLTMALRSAEANGGTLRLIDDGRPGARFELVLAAATDGAPPLARTRSPETSVPAEAVVADAGPRPSTGASILLVDDEPMLTRFMERALQRRGHRCTCANRPEDALDVLKSEAVGIDLVVSDLCMPGMDGIEFVERLRAMGLEVPVIILSGNPDALPANRKIELGIVDLLCKPVRSGDLIERVESYLSARP